MSREDSPWEADLGASPVWVGFLDDRVLVATDRQIVALDISKGAKLWTFESGAWPIRKRKGPNPFDRNEPTRGNGESSGTLHGFRVVGDRVFCLRGDRELLAISGETGLPEWCFRATNGVINPMAWVGPRWVVLQTLRIDSGELLDRDGRGQEMTEADLRSLRLESSKLLGSSTVILDTTNGWRRGEYPQPEGQKRKWERPPLPLDDDRIALVINRQTVALFDVAKGVNSWVYCESDTELPKYAPPRLFGDSERLMLLHDGTELIRLDASTGKKRWSRPLGIENLGDRPEAIALDSERVYWANGATLNAARLQEGSLIWSRYLAGPNYGWLIELTDRTVMAFPGKPKTAIKDDDLKELPLLFCRRETGKLIQRLLFPVTVEEVAIGLAPRGAVIATQSSLWTLGERTPLEVPEAGR